MNTPYIYLHTSLTTYNSYMWLAFSINPVCQQIIGFWTLFDKLWWEDRAHLCVCSAVPSAYGTNRKRKTKGYAYTGLQRMVFHGRALNNVFCLETVWMISRYIYNCDMNKVQVIKVQGFCWRFQYGCFCCQNIRINNVLTCITLVWKTRCWL